MSWFLFFTINFPLSTNYKSFQIWHTLYQILNDLVINLHKVRRDAFNLESLEISVCNTRCKLSKKLIYGPALCRQVINADRFYSIFFLFNFPLTEPSEKKRRPCPSIFKEALSCEIFCVKFYVTTNSTCLVPAFIGNRLCSQSLGQFFKLLAIDYESEWWGVRKRTNSQIPIPF